MKKTRKKNYSYRRKGNSKKLRGGAGKLNTKKNTKKRPEMTNKNYEEQLYKSFPYGFVLHGEVGTKATKDRTRKNLESEFYESVNKLNNRKTTLSSVTGMPKQEKNSEGLMSAFAKGQQEGLTNHSRMMSAARRITQPIGRMTGVSSSEDIGGIMTQARTLMGPSTGKSKSFGSRGSKPYKAVTGTVVPGNTSRIPGYVRMTGTKVMPGNTVMPGPYDSLLGWFFSDNELFLEDTLDNGLYRDILENIPDIKNIIAKYQPDCSPEDLHFMMEFLLWGLEANKRLNKYRTLEGFQFKDSLGSYISGL
tara:strand:- start:140 stop:1057 length:918 start_codon:yes stop_codon:yes gene_type:complete